MADHMVYQVRVQFSLDPADPMLCTGEAIEWRRPGEDGWTLAYDNAHYANPLAWCIAEANSRQIELARSLPSALPFD